MTRNISRKLIYYADPMCPWCWGFSPVVKEIQERYRDHFHFSYVVGGLRTGEKVTAVNTESKEYIRDHWECAMYESGQPFDLEFVEEMEFAYDTEHSCRAVVAMRQIKPGSEFDFDKRLQEEFYTNKKNPTIIETFIEIAGSLGVTEDEFRIAYFSTEVERALLSDFEQAQKLHRKILPTLILETEGERTLIASGFTSHKKVIAKVYDLLQQKKILPEISPDSSGACEIEGGWCC